MDNKKDWLEEQQHFSYCREIINDNIIYYEAELTEHHRLAIQLHAAINSGDTELYNRLITETNLEEHAAAALRKNQAAYKKPYFGRIDYLEYPAKKDYRIYIGKNGVFKNKTDVLIADWRAPISGVYYENELGQGSYGLPDEESIQIDLLQKRTYNVENGTLLGFYDSDVATNDELLVQYLSRNKDVVLGEIIATIQKEQNEIIRESPFANIIVQGAAGSGKSTVAMHRISYLLYNYKHRFESNEYCVIGSNDLLLKYITSALPELDAPDIRHMRMDQLFTRLCEKDWSQSKKSRNKIAEPDDTARLRSTLLFMQELELYLTRQREKYVSVKPLRDRQIGTILTESGNMTLLRENPHFSIYTLLSTMDDRVKTRIKFLLSGHDKDKIQKKLTQYKGYYKNRLPKASIYDFYMDFLLGWAIEHGHLTRQATESVYPASSEDPAAPEASAAPGNSMIQHLKRLKAREYDIYDLAALALIHYRITQKAPNQEFGLLFLDEAQDFGISIYYVLKKILPDTYFTIMGDVSQNINYYTGLNDWQELQELFLTGEKDRFRLLQRSYRNTIEISEYAGRILDKASFGRYKTEPVIRHGIPVQEQEFWSEIEAAEYVTEVITGLKEKSYSTAAIICMTAEATKRAMNLFKDYIPLQDESMNNFTHGTYVLPVNMVKGLEFDAVILWNPDLKHSLDKPDTAKLLYVAATRALHELHVVQS